MSIPARLFSFLTVFILVLLVYWPGLSGPLLLDDIPNLYHLFRFADGAISWQEAFSLSEEGNDRPVAILSFILNMQFTGGDTWFLKLTNLAIHALCGVVMYQLTRLLLSREIHDESHVHYLALIVIALWLLSPFLLSTVLYVIQRMAQLSTLFVLCGLLLYVRGRMNYAIHKLPGISLMACSLLLFWPLAILSKQNGILLPALILLTEVFFFHDSEMLHVRKLRRWLYSLVGIIAVLVIAWFTHAGGNVLDYSGRDFTWYERLLTQPRVLMDYMANLLLVPGASPMSLFHDDYIKSKGLLEPVTTLPAILVAVMVTVAAFFSYKRRTGKIVFGLAFFYLAHLVESSIIPLELYFEHRNYLPAYGIYFSFVFALYLLLEKINFKKIAIVVLLMFPAAFAVLTHQRALAWQKESSIFFLSEISHPDSPRVNEGLAYFHLLMQNPGRSLYHLDKAEKLRPGPENADFYFKYLLAYCQKDADIPEPGYQNKLDFSLLDDQLSTINFFNLFVDEVESGKCDSLDLDNIADQLKSAVDNPQYRFETKHVRILLARLLEHIGRTQEAGEVRNASGLQAHDNNE